MLGHDASSALAAGQTRKSVTSALTATSRITGRPMTSHEEIHGGKDPRMSTGHDGAKASHRLPIRTLVAASVGNAVEWYDWTIYATFSIYFATQIFSAENESRAFILTFTTYALAFFFRPLGGFLLGRYADLKGRKQAMLLTIMLMAGGSLIIAILPTYATVGWLAPILLLLARIVQGMSLGGEVSGASAYLAEIAPPNRRGRYSSFFYVSTGIAVLLASLLGALLASTLAEDRPAGGGGRIRHVIPCSSRHHKFGHRPSVEGLLLEGLVSSTNRWSLLSFPRWHSA